MVCCRGSANIQSLGAVTVKSATGFALLQVAPNRSFLV